ncbi:MAG: formate transporter FocA [Chloroflexi bacterium]|nr:formate transporter FocA [Chloroflexota bacterium]
MIPNNEIRLDALLPPEMANRAEQVGVRKAHLDWITILILAILAGSFIGLGAIFATTVTAGIGSTLPYGISRFLAGLAFTLGLILVIVGGAELFTGNNLMIMAWIDRQISTRLILRNWLIVYIGNFIGSFATAVLSFLSGQYGYGNGAVGVTALATASAKVQLGFIQAIALGVLANALVCLAVWMTFSARTTTDRILAIAPPIAAFVAAGYEHSIANMYFIPIGLLIKDYAPASFWTAIGKTASDFSQITWGNFFLKNLLPVTIGNIIGGAILVGAVYWFVYLRKKPV